MADALVSGASVRKDVEVQLLSAAPTKPINRRAPRHPDEMSGSMRLRYSINLLYLDNARPIDSTERLRVECAIRPGPGAVPHSPCFRDGRRDHPGGRPGRVRLLRTAWTDDRG